jgi:hypothetical protein
MTHPDVAVPVALSKCLGFTMEVRNSNLEPNQAFIDLLRLNVTGARVLPKTRMIYSKLVQGDSRININGNGSEICRSFFERGARTPEHLTVDRLTALCGYAHDAFVRDALRQWLSGTRFAELGFRPIDMLYWEQRMGTWGGQYPAEQDISVDEVSPFNNRRLLTTLLSTPLEGRRGPEYPLYRALIAHLWAEALSLPINPKSFGRQALSYVRRHLPDPLVAALRRAGFGS